VPRFPSHRPRPPPPPRGSADPSATPLERSIRITRHALPLIVSAACLTLAATACTNTGDATHAATKAPTTSTAPTPAPALSATSARDPIRHYSQVNNRANAHDNAPLLDTVEDGPLYAMSLGGYQQDSAIAAKNRKPYKPWSYDAATAHLYIPTFLPGTPKWFAAAVTVTVTAYQTLIVVAQQPDHSWQMVLAADLDRMPLPRISLDADGYATAVAADGTGQPGFDAGRLRVGITDNFATGGKNSGSQFFTPTPASKQQTGIHDKDTHRLGTKGITTFAAANNAWNTAYGLKTTGGGALLLFTDTHTQTDTVRPGWQITPGPDARTWLNAAPRQSITDTFTCNDAALIPAPAAKAQLLGYTCELTGADGTPVDRTPPHVTRANDPKVPPLFPNPDVELHDNAGRTTGQIHAYNTGSPTRDNLRRWANREAGPFLDAAALPPSGDGITAWTDLLGRARSVHELYGVITAVLTNDHGALARLHQFIEATANWHDERGDDPACRSYRALADDLDALAGNLEILTEDSLITARQPGTKAAREQLSTPTRPIAPPLPPPPPRPRR
jgi:hypothetical protein